MCPPGARDASCSFLPLCRVTRCAARTPRAFAIRGRGNQHPQGPAAHVPALRVFPQSPDRRPSAVGAEPPTEQDRVALTQPRWSGRAAQHPPLLPAGRKAQHTLVRHHPSLDLPLLACVLLPVSAIIVFMLHGVISRPDFSEKRPWISKPSQKTDGLN
jgi:hypothetical protein